MTDFATLRSVAADGPPVDADGSMAPRSQTARPSEAGGILGRENGTQNCPDWRIGELDRRFRGLARAVAPRGLMGLCMDVEDVVQQCWVIALEQVEEGMMGEVRFVMMIVRRRVCNLVRRSVVRERR